MCTFFQKKKKEKKKKNKQTTKHHCLTNIGGLDSEGYAGDEGGGMIERKDWKKKE